MLEGLPGENIGGGSASGPVVAAVLKRWKELYYKEAPAEHVPVEPESSLFLPDEYLPDD